MSDDDETRLDGRGRTTWTHKKRNREEGEETETRRYSFQFILRVKLNFQGTDFIKLRVPKSENSDNSADYSKRQPANNVGNFKLLLRREARRETMMVRQRHHKLGGCGNILYC